MIGWLTTVLICDWLTDYHVDMWLVDWLPCWYVKCSFPVLKEECSLYEGGLSIELLLNGTVCRIGSQTIRLRLCIEASCVYSVSSTSLHCPAPIRDVPIQFFAIMILYRYCSLSIGWYQFWPAHRIGTTLVSVDQLNTPHAPPKEMFSDTLQGFWRERALVKRILVLGHLLGLPSVTKWYAAIFYIVAC